MTLAHLIPKLTAFPPLTEALDRMRDGKSAIFDELPDAARAALIAATVAELQRPVVLVTARRDRADALAAAVGEYLPSGSDVLLWPAADAMPFEQLPIDLDASVRRVQQLAALRSRRANVIVTPVSGLMQLVMPRREMAAHTLLAEVGSRLAIEDLIAELKENYTIVIVTHNMQQAARCSDRTGFFNIEGTGKPGQLVEFDDTGKIFNNPSEKATEDYISGRFG